MQGHGNLPSRKDTLFLVFYDNLSLPETVWYLAGDTLNLNPAFQEARIHIKSKYLHAGFKFRFQTLGNAGGPFDHWHIDYVYINKNRRKATEPINDLAFGTLPTSIFKKYTMIPLDHFKVYPDTIYSAVNIITTSFNVFGNGTGNTVNMNYNLSSQFLNEENPEILNIFEGNKNSGTFTHDEIFQHVQTIDALDPASFANAIPDRPQKLKFKVELVVSDVHPSNDTSSIFLELGEVLAYDDGTAENSAGVKSETGGAQIAVFFDIPTSDTLTHVDIYFPNIQDLPDISRFKLSIARDTTGAAGSIYTSQEFNSLAAAQGIDVFTSFEFEKPAILTGGFYVIFEQFTNYRFPIGLDQNTKNGDKIYLNYGGGWERNNLNDADGSLMIRPRFADSDYIVTSIPEEELSTIIIYPNPSKNVVFIEGAFDRYELFNLSGKKVLEGDTREIHVHTLVNGMYLLKVSDQQRTTSLKVMVRH